MDKAQIAYLLEKLTDDGSSAILEDCRNQWWDLYERWQELADKELSTREIECQMIELVAQNPDAIELLDIWSHTFDDEPEKVLETRITAIIQATRYWATLDAVRAACEGSGARALCTIAEERMVAMYEDTVHRLSQNGPTPQLIERLMQVRAWPDFLPKQPLVDKLRSFLPR